MTKHRNDPHSDNIRLAISCGGTGGHFYPGLTIAKEFNRRGGRAILFIAGNHTDEHIAIARKENVEAVESRAIKLPRESYLLPVFAVHFLIALVLNLKLLVHHRITVALGMGSFASAPFGLAARLSGRPLFLHEGNAVLGRTNRELSRFATVLMLSFPLRNQEKTRARQKLVGMPIRDRLIEAGRDGLTSEERTQLYRERGLDPELPTLLVFGGSQGAKRLNDLMTETVKTSELATNRFQIIHITGTPDNSVFIDLYKDRGIGNMVIASESRIENLFLMADLILCRAGGSTISELAFFGKPALYVPLASALDDHQSANAAIAVENNGGYLLQEKECSTSAFSGYIKRLVSDREQFQEIGRNLKAIAKPKAACDIVNVILEST